jgi:hypothetical protein
MIQAEDFVDVAGREQPASSVLRLAVGTVLGVLAALI